MSFPTIPDVKPTIAISREASKNLLFASIAFEELGLSHLINAEAEKIQYVLGTIPEQRTLETAPTMQDLLGINKSVQQTMRHVIQQELLLQMKLEEVAAIPGGCQGTKYEFPSAASSVIASGGFLNDVEIGWFWSAFRGDSVSQQFAASDVINRAVLDIDVVSNVLQNDAYVTWELVINGTGVGSFTIEEGFTGRVTAEFAFPIVAGPIYQVELKVVNQVPVGDGSITLAYASDLAHSITLIDCDQTFTELEAPTVALRKSATAKERSEEYSLELNNRHPE